MREILFRGKNRYENQWVYGAYSLWDYSPETESMTTDTSIIDYNDECLWVRVIPETVGQYTGLTDKNGKEIFEGDIVKTKTGRLCEVYWFSSPSMLGWDLRPIEFKNQAPTPYDLFKSDNLEVIGNIHDNPELLTSMGYFKYGGIR